MPTSVWLSWKRSLVCKSQPGEVHDPQTLADSKVEAVFVTRRLYRSGCSRSIANLKDVIHSSRRLERSTNFMSPRSVESSDFIQPISHEAILRVQGCHDSKTDHEILAENFKSNSHVYGTPVHQSAAHVSNSGYGTPLQHSAKGNTLKKFSGCYDCRNPAVSLVVYKASTSGSLPPIARPVCQRCGDVFPKYEALEQHHLLRHAVTELEPGDSSRNVVEIIFRTSWLRGGDQAVLQGSALKIERVLKVNNLPKTLSRFEEYREGVKARSSKLPKKHPRCLADGNELLRFYSSSLMCGLAGGNSPAAAGVCSSTACNVCHIIRWGFRSNTSGSGSGNLSTTSGTTSSSGGSSGTLTAASSGHAHHHHQHHRSSSSSDMGDFSSTSRRPGEASAMLVCRVIAGRVHKPSIGGDCGSVVAAVAASPPPGFDSVAGDAIGPHTRIEELTVFNPRAILPCFVVIYRC